MNSALVILAHPKLEQSRVNQRMYQELKALDNVVVHDLYEMYPEFFIDVKYEQAAMKKASLIVFQHPFYWYSTPALLKEWLDQVLERGWAYGETGTALKGKTLLTATSTGSTDQAYTHGGYNNFTMKEFLRPFEQTANLCGMKYLEPFILHSARNSDDETILKHALAYCELIQREING
jgi:glutathione-regulated potassium-efflux system ancillary protein KefG